MAVRARGAAAGATSRRSTGGSDGRSSSSTPGGGGGGGPSTVFVRGLAGSTRTVRVELQATLAELEAAVREKGLGQCGDDELRLCAVGGAPLALRRHAGLTLAECGIRAGSSLQLLGRLRGGGGEVVLGGRTFPLAPP